MTRARRFRAMALAGASLAWLAAAPARAATPDDVVSGDDPFAGAEGMADDEMADARGGFELPDGQQINFGAVVSTYAGGVLALQTELTVDDSGAIVQQQIGELGQSLASLTDQQRHDLGLDGAGQSGVVISDASGVTALVQNITNSGLTSVIYNTASGRDLRQQIDVTITLPNFQAMQNAVNNDLVGLHLHDDIGAALAAAGG